MRWDEMRLWFGCGFVGLFGFVTPSSSSMTMPWLILLYYAQAPFLSLSLGFDNDL
jgi:hypothetical protein